MKKRNWNFSRDGWLLILTLGILCWIHYILYPVLVFHSYPILFLTDDEWCEKHSMRAPNCVKRSYTTLMNIKLKTNILHNRFYVTIPVDKTTQKEDIREFTLNKEEFVIPPMISLKEVFFGNK